MINIRVILHVVASLLLLLMLGDIYAGMLGKKGDGLTYISNDEFEKYALHGTKSQKENLKMYIAGVGAGYQFANSAINHQRKAILSSRSSNIFCESGELGGNDFFGLALAAIKDLKSDNNKYDGTRAVEITLLLYLKDLYPCER